MNRYLSGKVTIVNFDSIKEKLKQENISLRKHSTAFAQLRLLFRFAQQDG